jgi:hypothetical protein
MSIGRMVWCGLSLIMACAVAGGEDSSMFVGISRTLVFMPARACLSLLG